LWRCGAVTLIIAVCSGAVIGGVNFDRRSFIRKVQRVFGEGIAKMQGTQVEPGTPDNHEIHKEQPQLVIDAIHEVVEAVRSGSWQLAR
jgi:hypothetical protein